MGASSLAVREHFSVPLFALDDHVDEMRSATRETRKWHINTRVFETAVQWAPLAKKSDGNTILISDNFLQGVNDLSGLECPEIATSNGEEAGLRLLTSYCDKKEIRPGLKVLLTQFPLRKQAEQYISRREASDGDKIHVFRKQDSLQMKEFEKLLRKFSCSRHTEFVRVKVNYIRNLAEGWKLSEDELANVFGLQDASDNVWRAVELGTTSRDIETRCDLLYRVKYILLQVYGPSENLEQEARWLRTKIRPLGNTSPIDFISESGIDNLLELIAIMDGNV